MSEFNLIDEAWIPVRKLDGERVELGIRDTLLKAKEIAVIEDPSPLVTAALYRFLLAVLYRALNGPTDIDQARAWFKSGLPADKIDAYLECWRERFWLFDQQYPFFQIPDFEPKVWRAWTVLAAEHNADNAKVLFDHVDVTRAGSISPSAAARWLLAAQTFAFTGNSEFGYSSFSPSVNAAMVIPLGNNLEDTLMLCLVDQNRDALKGDKPLWEMEPISVQHLEKGVPRSLMGHAQLYTWASRAIRLRNAGDGVAHVAFAAGIRVIDACGDAQKDKTKDGKKNKKAVSFTDPMAAYHVDKESGKQVRRFSERGLWRDFDSLLPDGADLAPAVIEHATALTRSDRTRFPRSVMVLGQSNNKAKIEFWRLERFALPEALLGDRSIRTEIHQLLTDAETNQQALWRACKSFARDLLSRGERTPDAKDISRFVDQMPVSAAYWSTLEAAFHDVLRHYTAESDPDAIRLAWLKTVRSILRDAWQRHAASVATSDAWAIRALVRAEAHVNRQISALNKEIQQYETYRQTQEETA